MAPGATGGRTLLVIEDEAPIRRIVKRTLAAGAARVLEAASGGCGIELAAAAQPDLVILDLTLPDRPGIDVCREIRQWSAVPILVLSASHLARDKVALLDAGADDFLTKPFSTVELAARVRACMRRAERAPAGGQTGPLEIGELSCDPMARTLLRDGRSVHLTPIEWRLLRVLMAHEGRTFTHSQLLAAIWERPLEACPEHALRIHVGKLRRKIERDATRPRLILTEPGVGYRFERPPV